jgi:hypothetical protein
LFLKNRLHTGLFLVSSALLMAQTARTPTELGRKALDLVLAEKYTELSGMFSENFKETIALGFLQQKVSAELKEFGQAQSIGEPILGADGANKLVSFPVRFSNTSIHVQFIRNPSSQFAGVYFRPPNKTRPYTRQRPPYSKPESFHERELTIVNDMWKLGGALTTPVAKDKVPGIVLVHGPAPTTVTNRFSPPVCSGISPKVWLHGSMPGCDTTNAQECTPTNSPE